MWRGSLLPLGCAAAPTNRYRGVSGLLRCLFWGCFSPAGINPLATRRVASGFCGEGACSRWVAQQPPGVGTRGVSGLLRCLFWGCFSPAGINPLATGASHPAFVARELAPAGLRSSPQESAPRCVRFIALSFWGCFAAQREQAPSPQGGLLAVVVYSQPLAINPFATRRVASSFCGEGACSRWVAQQPPGIGIEVCQVYCVVFFGAASQPSGSKLPRHRGGF
ncbi:hypothetical protein SAMN03159474_05443 [Pseudomonas sp. NFACC08-1]|nr:hypothetical protein SAMN03159474_05443 [Pseudomonas sp. NFACC08-1]